MLKRHYWLIIIALFISGCATARHSVPFDQLNNVRIFGMQDIRTFGGSPSDSFKKDFVHLLEQEEKKDYSFFDWRAPRTYYMLAISGGGANGAYGAGLLNGWSKVGTRPEFRVVTGISTGAAIAPFAFLGSSHDATLKEFYTKYSTRDIARMRGIPSSNSFASARPMEHLIARYFNADLLKEIAVEYNKGRRLYVGTTNLDAQRLVIWDMGKIASKYPAVRKKVFLIHGEEDTLVPVSHSIYAHKHIPGSKLLLLKNTGHMIVQVRTAELIKVIEEAMSL